MRRTLTHGRYVCVAGTVRVGVEGILLEIIHREKGSER